MCNIYEKTGYKIQKTNVLKKMYFVFKKIQGCAH